MNILVLTNEYPNENYPKPDWTWVVPYFCREWVKQGHNVIVINNASAFPKLYYKIAKLIGKQIADYFDISDKGLDETKWCKRFEFLDYGVKVYNLPMKKYFPGSEYSNKVIRIQLNWIVDILKQEEFKPDVMTGHWLNPQLRLIYELKDKDHCKDAKTALVFHGDYSQDNCKKHKAFKYIKSIDVVGCRSMTARKSIKRYISNKKVFVCASGIPDEYVKTGITNKKFHKDRIEIFTAGRLVKYKKIDVIINACSESLDTYILRIAGDGPLKNDLKFLIENKGLSRNTELLGKIKRDLVQSYMKQADVFVLISEKETFGLVYLEAMLQGCIVIASFGGGVDGIIKDGENGFLCRQGDSDELSRILLKIKEMNEKEKSIISKNAIATAKTYTNSKVAERYIRAIAENNIGVV